MIARVTVCYPDCAQLTGTRLIVHRTARVLKLCGVGQTFPRGTTCPPGKIAPLVRCIDAGSILPAAVAFPMETKT